MDSTPRDAPADNRPGGDPPGGDDACWLHRVCPECGAFRTQDPPAPCDRCGAGPQGLSE